MNKYLWDDVNEVEEFLANQDGEADDMDVPNEEAMEKILNSFNRTPEPNNNTTTHTKSGVSTSAETTHYGCYGGTYTTTRKFCSHDGADIIADLNGLRIRGASKLDINRTNLLNHKTLVVNFSGNPLALKSPIVLNRTPDGFKHLAKHNVRADELLVDWDDMEAPLIARDFWADLHKTAKRAKYTDILFCCVGGHGRTGTALASMLISVRRMTPSDAANTVRYVHCRDAIETLDQIDYLYYVANLDIDRIKHEAKVSKSTLSSSDRKTLAAIASAATGD